MAGQEHQYLNLCVSLSIKTSIGNLCTVASLSGALDEPALAPGNQR